MRYKNLLPVLKAWCQGKALLKIKHLICNELSLLYAFVRIVYDFDTGKLIPISIHYFQSVMNQIRLIKNTC